MRSCTSGADRMASVVHSSGGHNDLPLAHDGSQKPFVVPTIVGSTPASAGGDEADALSAMQKMTSAVSGSLLTAVLGMFAHRMDYYHVSNLCRQSLHWMSFEFVYSHNRYQHPPSTSPDSPCLPRILLLLKQQTLELLLAVERFSLPEAPRQNFASQVLTWKASPSQRRQRTVPCRRFRRKPTTPPLTAYARSLATKVYRPFGAVSLPLWL